MREIKTIGPEEMQAQREYMRLVREMTGAATAAIHIVSMGCQMNARDSETIAGMLEEMGMRREDVRERADLILYNTCCVRENAENKALGNVIWLKELKKRKAGADDLRRRLHDAGAWHGGGDEAKVSRSSI